MAKHQDSPSEPHDFVAGPDESDGEHPYWECQVCGDSEGGDLHVSREINLYFVSAGESLAEVLQDSASPIFDNIAAARQYATDHMPGGVDADDFIYRLPIVAQAFDLERVSDDD